MGVLHRLVGLGIGLARILDDAPLWLRLLIIGPVSWALPSSTERMPWVARVATSRRGPQGGSALSDRLGSTAVGLSFGSVVVLAVLGLWTFLRFIIDEV